MKQGIVKTVLLVFVTGEILLGFSPNSFAEQPIDHYFAFSIGGVYDGNSFEKKNYGGMNLSLSYALRIKRFLTFATLPDLNLLSRSPDNYDWNEAEFDSTTSNPNDMKFSDCVEQSTGKHVSDDFCNQEETDDLAFSSDINFLILGSSNSPFVGIGSRVGRRTNPYLSFGWFKILDKPLFVKGAVEKQDYFQLNIGGVATF